MAAMTSLCLVSSPASAAGEKFHPSISQTSKLYPFLYLRGSQHRKDVRLRVLSRSVSVNAFSSSPSVPSPSSPGLYSAKVYELTMRNVDLVLEDVRPYLITDGGNVDVVSVEDGVISLKLQGACGSCPSSTTTMKLGIERVLKEKFGDAVKDIRQVFDEQQAGTTVKAVDGHLDILRPAIKNYGGIVEVVSVEGGDCHVRSGFLPSNATLVTILCLCAEQGKLDVGRAVHGYIVVIGLELNMTLGTSLIDVYSNCGAIGTAMEVFAAMPVKNVASWNCLIFGLATNGYGAKAMEFFDQMKHELNVRPNGVTFLGVLQACTQAGLVENGVQYFTQMSRDYGISPSLKHYGCIVDLYGKAGKVQEAMEVMRTMPMKPDNVIWVALFSACRTHGYRELGELMSANAIKLGANDTCGYMLLSDAYAIGKRWDDVISVRRMMREMDIKKIPGLSCNF